jgi:hypothetical protein
MVSNELNVSITIPYTTTVTFGSVQLMLMVGGQYNDFYDSQSQLNGIQHLKIIQGSTIIYDDAFDYMQEGFSMTLNAGTYTVIVNTSANAGFGAIGQQYYLTGGLRGILYLEMIAKTKFGNNGFYSYWGSNNYFYYRSDVGGKIRGGFDAPCVPCVAAYITSAGTIQSKSGRLSSNLMAVRTSTGIYKITHNVGHANYIVNATARSTTALFCRVDANGYNANDCQIIVHSDTGALTNSDIFITITEMV